MLGHNALRCITASEVGCAVVLLCAAHAATCFRVSRLVVQCLVLMLSMIEGIPFSPTQEPEQASYAHWQLRESV